MRKSIKNKIEQGFRILILIFVSFFFSPAYSQEKILTEKGDTIIGIFPKDIITVNQICVDLENKERQNIILEKIVENDSIIISKKDSIINIKSKIYSEKEYYYNKSIEKLEKSLKEEKRKSLWYSGVLGGVAVILGILVIVN